MPIDQMSELEKLIYNKHLAVTRSLKNKPFRFKKDFSDIVDTDKHKYLKRLAIFLRKHPDVELNVFFEAPYKLYPDVAYFGLDYFSSMRAIRAYTLYRKMLFLKDPDSQIESVKESLKFIANFCIEEKILLHQYPHHKISDHFTWMTHYKENKINILSMMEFKDVYSSVQTLAEDIQRFFVQNFIEQFKSLYVSYNNSSKLKPFLKKAVQQLNNFVSIELTKQKNHIQ
jgi:hypothetical protein